MGRVRPLPVVCREKREHEQDSAGGAIALRLIDEQQCVECRRTRSAPLTTAEESKEEVERRVHAIVHRRRGVNRLSRCAHG